MKKIMITILLSVLIFSMVFIGISCKEETTSETAASQETEEEAAAEETATEKETTETEAESTETDETQDSETSGDNPFPAADSANIDWKQFAGTTLNLTMVEHWYTDAIEGLIPEFEDLTGITIKMDKLSEEPYYQKIRLALSSGDKTPDIYMVGNLDIAQFATAGWLEPVDSYVSDPELTDKDWYDYDDILATIKKAGTFDGKMCITGIPSAEIEILYYRKDILEQNNVKVPETYDELYEAAKKLHTDEINGFVTRGERGISSWWEWTGMFLSYGGKFFDEQGKSIFNSPEGVAATEMFGKLQNEFGPEGVETYTWMMNVGHFRSGKAVFCLEASGVTPLMIDPAESQVIGKIGYAQIPHAEGKDILTNYWTWALGMNANSEVKDASWLLLEWLSSKNISYVTSLAGGAGAVRESILQTSALEDAFGSDWTNVVIEGLSNYVEPSLIPYYLPEAAAIAEEISIGLSNVLTGVETPQEAMDNAAQRVDDLLVK